MSCPMLCYTRLFTGEDGTSRFEDVEVPLSPAPPHEVCVSQPIPASEVLFRSAPAHSSTPKQPESRRQFVILLTGSIEVTVDYETRVFGPGDVLLAEDVDGPGHAARTSEGFTIAVVAV
jgi:quercetin dioxygenase-like cupin family protein